MAISNKERVGRGLDVLRRALRPIVEQELRALVAIWLGINAQPQDPGAAGIAITGGLFDGAEE